MLEIPLAVTEEYRKALTRLPDIFTLFLSSEKMMQNLKVSVANDNVLCKVLESYMIAYKALLLS